MASYTTPPSQKLHTPAYRHKSASPWRVIRHSPYLGRAPNPLIPRLPVFPGTSKSPTANPLFQEPSPLTQTIPETIVNLTLSFSLFDNGEGRDLNNSIEFDEVCKVFPTCFSVSYDGSYVVVGVKELPPRPWPTFLANLPLWLTTTPNDLGFENGKWARGPSITVKGDIKRYVTPDDATVLEILNLVNEMGAGVDRIRWDGDGFVLYGTSEPAEGWNLRLPGRVNDWCRLGYMWRPSALKEQAFRRKLPAPGNIKDDTQYLPNQLRPGVMIGCLANDRTTSILTTSGVCVQSPDTGKRYITVAAHGFPGGVGNIVYQPEARLNANGGLDDSRAIGTVSKVFGDSDIALVELYPHIQYSRETFSDASAAPNGHTVQPFRELRSHDQRSPRRLRKWDQVFMNTPFNGLCMGSYLKTEWFKPPASADTPPEEENHVSVSHFVYWGNGGNEFLDGCCGGVLWDENFDVLGHFRFQEEVGEKHAVFPSFKHLKMFGYELC
jgi:hypothetical protein